MQTSFVLPQEAKKWAKEESMSKDGKTVNKNERIRIFAVLMRLAFDEKLSKRTRILNRNPDHPDSGAKLYFGNPYLVV